MQTDHDITCNDCGKLSGTGMIGTNWICGDCQIAPEHAPDNEESAQNPPAQADR